MRRAEHPTVVARFEAQARRAPARIAATSGRSTVTYGALNAAANALAWRLIERGIGPEARVAVACNRSIDVLVAILAVLKSGAAYVPLDRAHPPERLRAVLARAAVAGLLVNRPLDFECETAVLSVTESPRTARRRVKTSNPTDRDRVQPLRPLNAAYVIHTSGSTGAPKGVVVTHQNLAAFTTAILETVPLTADDTLLASTTISFDISILELIVPLCVGARVVIAREAEIRHPRLLSAMLQAHRITCMQATPSYWKLLTKACTHRIAMVLCGGERLQSKTAAALGSLGDRVLNLYGPTETTIWSTAHVVGGADVDARHADTIAIGRPIASAALSVRDDRLGEISAAVVGQLWIGGAAVARGYLNDPRLTAVRFVADPNGPPGSRMYRTGDLVTAADAGLQFVGREDDQVKIFGHRVEPAEIESVLEQCDGVERAAVVVPESRDDGVPEFVAYIVPSAGAPIDAERLTELVCRRLPAYMKPRSYVPVDDLPLTPAGKIDRVALRRMAREGPPSDVPPAAASDESVEQRLCGVIGDVLGVAAVSADDDIFDLGADSIAATRLSHRIAAEFGVELAIVDLIDAPTVAALLARIVREDTASGV